MKNIIFVFAFLVASYSFAQDNLKKVTTVQKGDLIEATYYSANGSIEQQGTFNKEGKLHGLWVSYNADGEKITSGNYENGKKVGKWLFWNDDTLKEVDYENSQISNVVEKDKNSKIVY